MSVAVVGQTEPNHAATTVIMQVAFCYRMLTVQARTDMSHACMMIEHGKEVQRTINQSKSDQSESLADERHTANATEWVSRRDIHEERRANNEASCETVHANNGSMQKISFTNSS